jgi:ABC-2 type transport system permease protein
MANISTIMQKELKSYFLSPVFYFVTFFFLIISGGWFTFIISQPFATPDLGVTFNIMVYLLFPICPVLTMHLFSEERRSGTIELLMTYPLKDWEVVAGKYLASLVLFLVMVLCTIQFPVILFVFGQPDYGPILSSYMGFIFLGASFLAVGTLGSALAKSQMLASVISFTIVFGLMIFGVAGHLLGPGRLGNVLEYLPGTTHFKNFAMGLLDTRDLTFFLSFIFFSLFTAVRVVEIKRWK